MNAMKVDGDIPRAIVLFREALALNPTHEDSRYYLGNCLAMTGDLAGALSQLEELMRIDPQSQRAYRQWGAWRAMSATSAADLVAAEQALHKALAINPEETGTLLLLGEIALLRGEAGKAEERLALACRTNARAAGGFFLRGYIAWKLGDEARARELLVQARRAFGESWAPKGATSEGDVRQKMHTDATPLLRFWEEWDGTATSRSFAALDGFLVKRTKDLRPSSPARHEH
ncbi:MAG: tetratricopeptide repeat protein [Acidobacteria bacterium]|nr:tetratricopeptide repeat protein [Acidobacteriota bacterium]